MKIPKESNERQGFYSDVLKACLVSRRERMGRYSVLRNYRLFGSRDSSGCSYNKIGSTVETLKSFMYAPDSTRFKIHLGETAMDDIEKAPIMARELNDNWRMTRTHLTFGRGIDWALTYGCMLFKPIWVKGLPRPYLVDPGNFGVLNESLVELADQEAFVHCYKTTKTQLETTLEDIPESLLSAVKKNSVLDSVHRGEGVSDSAMPEGASRLVDPGAVGGITGSLALNQSGSTGTNMDGPEAYDYMPQVELDLCDMFELYVWNDEVSDYQMVTMADPSVVLFDRKQTGVPGLPTFIKLSPEDTCADYFWGESFVAKLTKLQDIRTERQEGIRKILGRQEDPPLSLAGFGGIAEEKMRAFRERGGLISSSMPGAKADMHAPSMPPNIFTELDQYDRYFDDVAGIGHILQGKGEPGVRSKGQADLMARLGSARPKSRAIVIEESCEDLAQHMLRLIQLHSKQRFELKGQKNPDGNATLLFTPAQFTNDYEVRVDAHSSSPIFVEDRKRDADALIENKAIDRATYLEMYDPPGLQHLLSVVLPRIEKHEQEQAAREAAAQGQKGAA